MTIYVATRWYRAPELILSNGLYSEAVDVWSCGCILAELFNRKPLFKSIHNTEQLMLILKTLGTPSADDLTDLGATGTIYNLTKDAPFYEGLDFKELFPKVSDEARDLIRQMLIFNPKKRITIDGALRHEYFREFADCLDELTTTKEEFTFSLDSKANLTLDDIKQEIFKETMAFHPEIRMDYSPYDTSFKEILKSYSKHPGSLAYHNSNHFKHP
eukprot:TRINITY_DN6371_c0_g2_i3.p1 TRINITY_DN6371_c0_g2~~TRINITY_DN6371_c0_g2_i3.p1  ORF type:complete len:215 (-),score=43.29 TRINITY_DN6371_c0_g2_i3:84-728(-)